MLGTLSAMAAEALGDDVPVDVPLMFAGLDSLGAVELKNGVSAKFGVTLPATVAFDYPTLEASCPLIYGLAWSQPDAAPELWMHHLQAMAHFVASSSAAPKATPMLIGRRSRSGEGASVQEDVDAFVADVLGSAVPPDHPLMQASVLGKQRMNRAHVVASQAIMQCRLAWTPWALWSCGTLCLPSLASRCRPRWPLIFPRQGRWHCMLRSPCSPPSRSWARSAAVARCCVKACMWLLDA